MENDKKDGFVIITREYMVNYEYAGMDIVATTTSLKRLGIFAKSYERFTGKTTISK